MTDPDRRPKSSRQDPQSPESRRAKLVLTHRLLVFSGSAWLLSSWLIVIGMRQPMLPSISTWLPGVRLMLAMSSIGLIIVWPMASLSARRTAPAGRTLRDSIILLLLAQLIVWPAALVMAWSLPRAALISAVLSSWGLLAAAVTAWGRRSNRMVTRTSAMALCLVLVLAAPAVLMFNPSAAWLTSWSPLTNLWSLADGGIDDPTRSQWRAFILLSGVVLFGWVVVALIRPRTQSETRAEDRP